MKSPWRDGFFFFRIRRSGWINGADMCMDEIDPLRVFLFKRDEMFGKEKNEILTERYWDLFNFSADLLLQSIVLGNVG